MDTGFLVPSSTAPPKASQIRELPQINRIPHFPSGAGGGKERRPCAHAVALSAWVSMEDWVEG